MSNWFEKIENPLGSLFGNVAGWIWNPGHYILQALFKLISPKIVTPEQKAGVQVYQIDNQQNAVRIGAPQAVVYGKVRRWPEFVNAWSEYINNDQVLHTRLRLSVGICSIEDLRIGDAAAYSFPGFEYQLNLPGEPMTRFHPNVYTNPEVTNIEFAAGALVNSTYTGPMIFGPSGYPGRIDHDGGAGVFAGVPVGTDIIVVGAGVGYDGTYTVLAHSEGDEWVDTAATFTPTTLTCTVKWGRYDTDNNDVKQAEDVALVFDNALSQIAAAPTEANPHDLSVFATGDRITPVNDPAGANKNVVFTVVGKGSDGLSLLVTPAPTSLSGISTMVLLRRYHGPFVACPAGATINQVGVDVRFPQGLGNTNPDNGDFNPSGVRFDIQWQAINDAGTPLGDWTSFDEVYILDAKRTEQRRTVNFSLPECRAQVRIARTSKDETKAEVIDSAQWSGLKGFLVTPAGEDYRIDEDSTTLAVSLRASGTLANGSDKKINCLTQRWLETYDAATHTWLPEQPTQAVVWAALDKLRGRYTRKSRQVADGRIDLTAFLSLHATLEAAGRQFNGAIETESTLLENVNEILQLGRARLIYDWRAGKFTTYRDESKTPVQAFSDNNARITAPFKITAQTASSPTGVQASYQDPTAWEERIVGYPYDSAAPELSGGSRPLKVDMRNGCTQRQAAWEEAAYSWNVQLYRNRTLSLSAELEPVMLRRGDRLLVQNREHKWGWGAKVTLASGRTLTVWPAPEWLDAVQHFVYLRGPDGMPGAKINCSRGSMDSVLLLDADPDVELTGDANFEEQTHVLFGRAGDEPQIMILDECAWTIADDGGSQASLSGALDDARALADPGPVYADPDAVDATTPVLTIDNLSATHSGLTITATWSSVTDALLAVNAALDTLQINSAGDELLYRAEFDGEFLYEVAYRYAGDLPWIIVRRTTLTTATFAVPHSGVVQIGVQAIAASLIGERAIYSITV